MKTESFFKIKGRVISLVEKRGRLFNSKKISLQILLEEGVELDRLQSIAKSIQLVEDFNLLFETRRDPPIPICITYYPKNKKDGLYFANTGDTVEITFRTTSLSLEDYALKVHHFNPPILIETAVIA